MNRKICVITGANSEIAISIVRRLLHEYCMVLCWNKHHERIDELRTIDDAELSFYQADLTNEAAVEKLICCTYEKYHTIDLLVNCVGKSTSVRDDEITEDIWDIVIQSNLKPAYYLCKYYKKYHDKKTRGCIIHISSTAGVRALPKHLPYLVAKSGLISMSKYYAKVLAPNIRVNTIAPGYVLTEPHKSSRYKPLVNSIPLKRMADVSEIAATVAYIAECGYITGQDIILDGGLIS